MAAPVCHGSLITVVSVGLGPAAVAQVDGANGHGKPEQSKKDTKKKADSNADGKKADNIDVKADSPDAGKKDNAKAKDENQAAVEKDAKPAEADATPAVEPPAVGPLIQNFLAWGIRPERPKSGCSRGDSR